LSFRDTESGAPPAPAPHPRRFLPKGNACGTVAKAQYLTQVKILTYDTDSNTELPIVLKELLKIAKSLVLEK